jgi:hypothetical protein
MRLEGAVRDVSALQESGGALRCFAGHGDTCLSAIDGSGRKIWTRQIVRVPTSCAWWELDHPSVVQVVSGEAGGTPFLVIGCGDICIRGLDPGGGTTLWERLYENGVPARLEVADVDGDGEPEIIAGGEIISNQSTCRILTPGGHFKWQLEVEGWTSKLTAVAFAERAGRRLVACGATRGRNLYIYALDTPDATGDGEGSATCLLMKKLAGAVTGVGFEPMGDGVVAVNSQGFVSAFTLEGERRWVRVLDAPLTGLRTLDGIFLVTDNTGGVHAFSYDGEPCAHTALEAPARFVAAGRPTPEVIVVSGNRLLRLRAEF